MKKIRIYYLTDWQNPKIYYPQKNTEIWQAFPLKKFQYIKNVFFIDLNINDSLIFVFCNEKENKWDNPRKDLELYVKNNNNYNNYCISEFGSYAVYNGYVIKIENDTYWQDFDYNDTDHIEYFFENYLKKDYYPQISDFFFKNKKKFIESQFIFVTDLDGTLCGDNPAQERFNIFWIKFCYFDKKKYLIYNTTRRYKHFLELKSRTPMIWPNYLILAIGNTIYFYDENKNDFFEIKEWENHLLKLAFNEFNCLKWTFEIPGAPHTHLNIFYQADFRENETLKIQEIEKIKENLAKKNVFIKYIISGKGPIYEIDIISDNSGKGKSLEFLAKKLKIDNIYAFGDAMADIDMFHASKKAILMGNSHENLLNWYKNCCTEKKIKLSKFYHAEAILNKLISILTDNTIEN